MKVILDTNLWVSFLIGHQTQLVRRMLTDLRFDVYVCSRLIEEIRDVVSRDKIRKRVNPSDVENLFAIINAFCRFTVIETEVPPSAVRDPKDLYLLSLADTIGADYIISGDADLTDLGQHNQTKIIKLADFKAMMLYL
ncbi:MAG: putative toxin-antitoxin system toxin component, PIN family [Bacteroidaceae bacterium]|jgi:putative PIN family toxin of toxin-antitoxin system|nr:putative toxin-antitoxin system toxin component, PIN family [Bacteroidaceae bacterium]